MRSLLFLGVLIVAFRLLAVAGGAATFTPPAPPPATGVFTVTAPDDGGGSMLSDPKGYYYNGRTYLGWVAGDGDIKVAGWNHSTETLDTPSLIGNLGVDDHNNPAILVRESDHRMVVAYSGHSTAAMRMRISTNSLDTDPTLSGGFAASVNLDGQLGGGRYTYPVLYQLRGIVDDPIYLLWRDIPSIISNTGRIGYSVSTDGGATWVARILLTTGASGRTPYWKAGTDWDTRIDIFTTERDPATSTGLWHFYIDGTDNSLHTSDGTLITTALPITVADMTLVEDNADGPLWSFGASWDGAPASIIMQNIGGDNRVKVARWRAGAWQVNDVVLSVGGQMAGDQYASGVAIHHTNPDLVYVNQKVAGEFELFRYTSADDGVTWADEQLSVGSSDLNMLPEVPHFAAAGLSVYWFYGSWVSDGDFTLGIKAAE